MRDLNYELKQLCHRNRDGSYATQRDRERVLDLIAKQLQELGYQHMGAGSLKPKQVERLVERWKAEGLAIGTIKNRMAEIRWWAEKIAKQNVVARDNEHYGIGNRRYVTNVSKARELTTGDLSKITDPSTRMSLRLQAAFGYDEDTAGSHAGITDTSQMLLIRPAGVRRDQIKPWGGPKDSGVSGDPTKATAEIGKMGVEFKVNAGINQYKLLKNPPQGRGRGRPGAGPP